MNKRIVCAGTFDHLHQGHMDYLKQARSLGEELIVIVARDETVMKIKGFFPTDDENTRKRNVEMTGIPERVVLGNLDSDLFLILEELNPDVIALGYDQRVPENEMERRFQNCKLVRLSSFHPEKYKSSFYRNNLNNPDR